MIIPSRSTFIKKLSKRSRWPDGLVGGGGRGEGGVEAAGEKQQRFRGFCILGPPSHYIASPVVCDC